MTATQRDVIAEAGENSELHVGVTLALDINRIADALESIAQSMDRQLSASDRPHRPWDHKEGGAV